MPWTPPWMSRPRLSGARMGGRLQVDGRPLTDDEIAYLGLAFASNLGRLSPEDERIWGDLMYEASDWLNAEGLDWMKVAGSFRARHPPKKWTGRAV